MSVTVSLALTMRKMTRANSLVRQLVACETIVRLYRRRVFAQIRASTRSRVDLGLALGDLPAGGRLLSTGGFEKGDRITHRVAVTATGQIDEELTGWLKLAYDRDA